MVNYKLALARLVEKAAITKDTATTYLSCVRVLADRVQEGGEEEIGGALRGMVKELVQLRKYINAIRKYEEIVIRKPEGLLSRSYENVLTNEYKRKPQPVRKNRVIDESNIKRKINGIHDLKTRITLRLELQSGLRVSEVAKLRVKDITFKDGIILVQVHEGKGRKSRKVKVRDDPYLYEKLQEYIGTKDKSQKLFDSRRSISKKSHERDIETHDLRRLNARMRVREEMEKGKDFKEAREVVAGQMGHSFPSTTDIYLGERGKMEGKKRKP